jgi:hypothetical protein
MALVMKPSFALALLCALGIGVAAGTARLSSRPTDDRRPMAFAAARGGGMVARSADLSTAPDDLRYEPLLEQDEEDSDAGVAPDDGLGGVPSVVLSVSALGAHRVGSVDRIGREVPGSLPARPLRC